MNIAPTIRRKKILEMLEPAAFHELIAPGDRIVFILRKHRIRMLSESI